MRTFLCFIVLSFAPASFAQVYSWGPHGYFGWGHWGFQNWPSFQYGYSYRVHPSSFGAISYSSSTGAVGYSYSAFSVSQAQNIANQYCGAVDCRPVVWVQGGCASAAVDEVSGTLGWSFAANRGQAVHWALQSCQNRAGVRCESLAWTCSY